MPSGPLSPLQADMNLPRVAAPASPPIVFSASRRFMLMRAFYRGRTNKVHDDDHGLVSRSGVSTNAPPDGNSVPLSAQMRNMTCVPRASTPGGIVTVVIVVEIDASGMNEGPPETRNAKIS